MSQPLITIKAGKCERDGNHVIPLETPGLLYVYVSEEDELLHFAWKARGAASPEEDDDLIVFPGEATLEPYEKPGKPSNGRVFVLKFTSSSQRRFFWLQSKSEKDDDPTFFSTRDLGWARRINSYLAQGGDGEDVEMGDVIQPETPAPTQTQQTPSTAQQQPSSSSSDPPPLDLMSLIRNIQVPGVGQQSAAHPLAKTAYLSLTDLLAPKNTLPLLYNPAILGPLLPTLKENLPPGIIPEGASERETIQILEKVLRSPQFAQANASLTAALREGALVNVAPMLGLDVNGVEMLGVGGLVEGVKRKVEKEKEKNGGGNESMDLD